MSASARLPNRYALAQSASRWSRSWSAGISRGIKTAEPPRPLFALAAQLLERGDVLRADAAAAADDVGAVLDPGLGELGVARGGQVGADVAEALVGGLVALRREGVGVD